MKLYAVCHKEFRDESVNTLSEAERNHVISYIVNESYPKDHSRFSALVSQVNEYELERYNPKYQLNNYYEYGAIAHVYLNESLRDSHVGILHSDIVFECNSINEMIEALTNEPDTIFYNTFFGPFADKVTQHPYYLSYDEVHLLCNYLTERIGLYINTSRVLTTGWVGGMSAGPVDVFIHFGEFMERYTDELEDILNTDAWHLQTYPGKHTICGIIERLWGFYLVSLNYPLKYMRIRHEQNKYEHDHR